VAVDLSVGLVVDDAIVRRKTSTPRIEVGMPPKKAGIEGSKSSSSPLSPLRSRRWLYLRDCLHVWYDRKAVFEFSRYFCCRYHFSFVALTFTPMIATKIKEKEGGQLLYRKTEVMFDKLNDAYE
jgi:multidrug efflux pump